MDQPDKQERTMNTIHLIRILGNAAEVLSRFLADDMRP